MTIRFIISLLLVVILSSNNSYLEGQSNKFSYLSVKKVIDGDTFWIMVGANDSIKIRLIGVDAPETRGTRQKRIGFYGQQSKEYLTKLISGQKVRLEYDIDKKDQYNRTLAYVFLPDRTFVNAELIKQGYAMVMTVPPNVKYVDEFLKFEMRARNQNRGLWNEKHAEH